MAELLRPGAFRVPGLEGKSLVVVAEYDSLRAIGEIGDRRGVIRVGDQLRGAVNSDAVDYDPIAGARLDQEAGFPLCQWRPQSRGAWHTLAWLRHMVPPDE